jgi:hypothetical protein
MDVLQNIIKSLEKEEIKSYKLYTKRTHNFEARKDVELFNNIKLFPDHTDSQHFKAVYRNEKADSRYYRLKNKISDDIGVVLSNLNRNEKEIEALHLVILSKIFYKKEQFQLAQHYLKLSEKKAIQYEDYSTLEIVYELFIQLSLHNIKESPEGLIKKREENSKRLALLQDLENNFSLLSHKLKTTQNLVINDAFKTWIRDTLQKTQKLSYVKNSSTLRLKVFQNICRLLLLMRDYSSLEKYLLKSNEEFIRDDVFNKNTHDIKIQLYIYLCNASYVLHKHHQALNFASQLQHTLLEHDKALYEKYLFYYYNILVNNYGKTNVEKAIETLEEARKQPVIKSNPGNMGFVLLNLAITHFDSHKYKTANKYIVQLYVSDAFKNYDDAFKLKISVFELCNKIESGEIEQAGKMITLIYKTLDDIANHDALKIELSLLKLLRAYLQSENITWRSIRKNIQDFLKKYPSDKEYQSIINYSLWLEAKI